MNVGKVRDLELNEDSAYLAGVVVGDGHISNSLKSKSDFSRDYRIVFDLSDFQFMHLVFDLISSMIETKSAPKSSKVKVGRKPRLFFQVRNKSLFYFLSDYLSIPVGKKSYSVFIPLSIKSSGNLLKHFMAGLEVVLLVLLPLALS